MLRYMVVADPNAGQDTVSSWTGEDSGVRRNTLASRTCPETLRAEAVLLDCKGSRSRPPGDTEQERPSRKTGSTGIGAALQGNRNRNRSQHQGTQTSSHTRPTNTLPTRTDTPALTGRHNLLK
ncbi:hypothetical protein D4764_05G0011690 [Takifugu flavidus]|uniref:Uncharacterized protein n=1 Tax=Takifugu flavidus TaxID=433684 RepID=A0A5C6N239_9TELE|nr:hypothetical protein D4764_05G0011690 [Takifugu flavidus]